MAKNDLWDFDQTAGNNTEVGGQSTQGSALVSTIDSIFQKFMAVLAGFAAKLGGTGTVGGTADAITLTTSATWPISSLVNGTVLSFKAGAANTGAATINVDSKGAKAIRRQGDSDLSANDIVSGGIYQLRYDTAYNSAAGAWVLLNPTVSSSLTAATTTETLTGTDASKYLTADAVAALWEKGSDVASASTISLGEGGFYHVTGTTTITDIDWATAKNGRGAWVVFDGILTLTHNATTLKLPTGANITTAAGDRAYFVQDSGDNVICLLYQRADGTALSVTASSGIGDSQTWDDGLTRSEGTSYQNTTGKPIMAAVAVLGSSNLSVVFFQISTNGSAWEDIASGVSSGGYSSVAAIIPNGHYYRVPSSGSYSVSSWSELR